MAAQLFTPCRAGIGCKSMQVRSAGTAGNPQRWFALTISLTERILSQNLAGTPPLEEELEERLEREVTAGTPGSTTDIAERSAFSLRTHELISFADLQGRKCKAAIDQHPFSLSITSKT
ncbi:unnamed protein product [Pleuronectes platessa]|uniref:Uncharacterized protein n=1 Tax=Pleuronectes platessa TaxID=8262 RepID=A0A9N7YQC0_PLEPL|nr:unnamed protein product [Pleuronectes platessa]